MPANSKYDILGTQNVTTGNGGGINVVTTKAYSRIFVFGYVASDHSNCAMYLSNNFTTHIHSGKDANSAFAYGSITNAAKGITVSINGNWWFKGVMIGIV